MGSQGAEALLNLPAWAGGICNATPVPSSTCVTPSSARLRRDLPYPAGWGTFHSFPEQACVCSCREDKNNLGLINAGLSTPGNEITGKNERQALG